MSGWVYFIQADNDGPIKIGFAVNPRCRRANLQIGNPSKLHIVAAFPGSCEMENDLHKTFAAFHISGEWFRPDQELVDFIKSLPNQRFVQKKINEPREMQSGRVPHPTMRAHKVDPMDPTKSRASQRLRNWRQHAGLTIEVAAKAVGVTAPNWCDWEHGKKIPRADMIFALEKLTTLIVHRWAWAEACREWRASRAAKVAA